ncbi:hypothetical protein P9112_005287 [Eukaryota sp. TZLM1-RC]
MQNTQEMEDSKVDPGKGSVDEVVVDTNAPNTNEECSQDLPVSSWLKNFHLPFLAMCMGSGGFSLMLKKAASIFEWLPALPYQIGVALTAVLFISLALIYLIKYIIYPSVVIKHELTHPIKSNFAPVFSIVILMVALGTMDTDLENVGKVLIWIGFAIQFPLALLMMRRWFTKQVQIKFCNPACLIAPVGLLLAGLAFARIGVFELAIFNYSASLFWWLMIFAQFLHRVLFVGMLPEKLIPMLFILLAPPCIATAATYEIYGNNAMVMVFYSIALFFAFLLIALGNLFYKAVKSFKLTWLAFVFPAASFAIGSLEVHFLNPDVLLWEVISIVAMIFATLVFFAVSVTSLVMVVKGKVFVEEDE